MRACGALGSSVVGKSWSSAGVGVFLVAGAGRFREVVGMMKVTGKWEEEDHGGAAGWPCGVVVWGAGLLAGRFWR
jgi:hypothetical protein